MFHTTGHLHFDHQPTYQHNLRRRRDLVAKQNKHRHRKQQQQKHRFEMDEDEEDESDLLDDDDEPLKRKSSPYQNEYYVPKNRRMMKSHSDDETDDESDIEPQFQRKSIAKKPPIKRSKEKRHSSRDVGKLHNSSTKKANRNKYSNEESKNVEKYDLLGSGNFEIIRGGIIEEEADKDGNSKKAKKGKKLLNPKKLKKVEESRPPVDQKTPTAGVTLEGEELVRRNDNEDKKADVDSEKSSTPPSSTEQTGGNEFEPFDFDLFANDPLLRGFQGYDNFGNLNTPTTGSRARRGNTLDLPLNL